MYLGAVSRDGREGAGDALRIMSQALCQSPLSDFFDHNVRKGTFDDQRIRDIVPNEEATAEGVGQEIAKFVAR